MNMERNILLQCPRHLGNSIIFYLAGITFHRHNNLLLVSFEKVQHRAVYLLMPLPTIQHLLYSTARKNPET
jgi:hypothetical protein